MSTRSIVSLVVVCLVFIILSSYVGDNDFWFHLRTGEYIWQNHTLPKADVFSYTALGVPWVNHEWGSQLIFYGTYSAFGFWGIGLLVALVGALTFFIISKFQKEISWPMAVFLIVSAYALKPFFVPRPQIFAYLCLALLMYNAMAYMRSKDRKHLWVIPVIVMAWANLHVSVVFAVGILGIITAYHFLYHRPEYRAWLIVTASSLFASLLNPFGYHLYVTALQPLKYHEVFKTLIETQPIFSNLNQGPVLVIFAIHLLLGFVFFRHARKNTSIPFILEKVLFGLFFLLPFSSIKYTPFSWTVLLSILGYVGMGETYKHKKLVQVAGVLAIFVVGYGVVTARATIFDNPHSQWPQQMMAFLDDHHATGNMYNPLTWGGYSMWQSKNRPVFIYGGFTGFYDRNFFESLDFANGKQVDQLIEKYKFSIILVRPWEALPYTLSLKADWALVYWDNFGMVYLRRGGENDAIIQQYEMRIPYINDAMEAVVKKYGPNNLPVLISQYEEAVRRQSDLLLARLRLGMLYQYQGSCEEAIPQWQAIVAIDPNLGAVHARLSQCYALLGEKDLADSEKSLGQKFAKNQVWWWGRP